MHRPVQLLCCYDIQRLCFVLLIKQVGVLLMSKERREDLQTKNNQSSSLALRGHITVSLSN